MAEHRNGESSSWDEVPLEESGALRRSDTVPDRSRCLIVDRTRFTTPLPLSPRAIPVKAARILMPNAKVELRRDFSREVENTHKLN